MPVVLDIEAQVYAFYWTRSHISVDLGIPLWGVYQTWCALTLRVGHVEVCEVCDYNQQHDFLKRVDFMEQLSDIRESRYKIRSKHS